MNGQIDLGGQDPAEVDLRLPRPPGLLRRFWARHPRLTDALLVVVSLLMALSGTALSAPDVAPDGSNLGWLVAGLLLSLLTAGSLMWRRRFPLSVFLITFVPIVLLEPSISTAVTGLAPVIALYSVAVYRSAQATLWALGAAVVCSAIVALVWAIPGATTVNQGVSLVGSMTTLLIIGALIGINVGNRKRYVEALIDRSRQLAVERDQQAKLAAAAERTRIAREMHDVVSHSLAVVVALAEGVVATDDKERARQASQAIADTAREALDQMRVMLGVLRTDPDAEASDLAAPLGPLLALSPQDVVDTARAAGVPVTLTVTGTPAGSEAQRLAVLRIVQEGLTNAMRYAHDPGFVAVETDYSGGRIRVRVDNDGVRAGEPSRGAGLGLQGLTERVASLGGTLRAGPGASGTWRLLAEFPLEVAGD